MNIDSSQTPEKFQHLTNEVLEFLVDKLQKINLIETEMHGRFEELNEQMNNSNQTHPDEDDLWDEYAQRCKAILEPISAKPYVDNYRTVGKPATYDYLAYPDTQIFLIIKSLNRAVVETQFEKGMWKKDQFVLKNVDGAWKIDSKKYSFVGEDTWRKDEL